MALGSVMSHYCIQYHGTQEHRVELSSIAKLLYSNYGFSLRVE